MNTVTTNTVTINTLDNPLERDPTAGLSAEETKIYLRQLNDWQLIVALSNEIVELVNTPEWDQVLPTAEQRDKLLEQFFHGDIASALLPKILHDVDQIKRQHNEVMVLVAKRDDEKSHEQQSLMEVRQDVQDQQEQDD